MEGRVIAGNPEAVWRGAALDSRGVRGGELFFALPGERSDGHRFVGDALERGAAAAVVHREVEVPEGATVIEVGDTFEALHALTRSVRRRLPEHLVGVTGSAGKTTTKELLAAMLARRFEVARNPGNLNNLYGFPIALLGIDEGAEWMVAEMGMSTPGELGGVSRLGQPEVAVFTNVRPVHLEFFDSVSAIGDAKAELLEGLVEGGLVVANADDPEVVRIARGHQSRDGRVVWYGLEKPADYTAVDLQPLALPRVGHRFTFEAPGGSIEVELPLYGRFNVENFLAAAACAHALGVELEEIAAAVTSVGPADHRGVVHQLPADVVVLDESYNSNPDACVQALEGARALPAQRRWAILGDMLELGPSAASFHREVGERAGQLGFSPTIGVGELSRDLAEAAGEAGVESAWFADAKAAEVVAERLQPGDLVLVKGSRGVGLERVVTRLLEWEGEA
jgi:UDP-N-acetylmuramoyl-tripeptide--D-alanyl-D-alanine ligase